MCILQTLDPSVIFLSSLAKAFIYPLLLAAPFLWLRIVFSWFQDSDSATSYEVCLSCHLHCFTACRRMCPTRWSSATTPTGHTMSSPRTQRTSSSSLATYSSHRECMEVDPSWCMTGETGHVTCMWLTPWSMYVVKCICWTCSKVYSILRYSESLTAVYCSLLQVAYIFFCHSTMDTWIYGVRIKLNCLLLSLHPLMGVHACMHCIHVWAVVYRDRLCNWFHYHKLENCLVHL